MSYSEYLGKYMEQQKEDETILERMYDDCVDFEEEGDLYIWEQENEITSHNPDQHLPDSVHTTHKWYGTMACTLFDLDNS